jgi:hypothetical protein
MKRNKLINKIPEGIYCDGCPLLKIEHITQTRRKILEKRGVMFTVDNATEAEWCPYIKTWLSIQDEVKDCGVNLGEEYD